MSEIQPPVDPATIEAEAEKLLHQGESAVAEVVKDLVAEAEAEKSKVRRDLEKMWPGQRWEIR